MLADLYVCRDASSMITTRVKWEEVTGCLDDDQTFTGAWFRGCEKGSTKVHLPDEGLSSVTQNLDRPIYKQNNPMAETFQRAERG